MTDFIQKDKNGKLIGLTINGNYYKKIGNRGFYSLNSLSKLNPTTKKGKE